MPPPKITQKISDWSAAELSAFLSSFDSVMCDCDGVLYRGSSALPGSPELIRTLKEDYGKKIIYVTNNSAKAREDYVDKFTQMGYPAEKVGTKK